MSVIWLSKTPEGALPEAGKVTGPLGEMWAVWHEDALCHLRFAGEDTEFAPWCESIGRQWRRDPVPLDSRDGRCRTLARWLEAFPVESAPEPQPLQIVGTAFQRAVWERLLQSRVGQTMSYGYLAGRLGMPGGARAVGQAVGANPVAIAIPCHRVLPSSGSLGGYRWGTQRKARLLEREKALLAAT